MVLSISLLVLSSIFKLGSSINSECAQQIEERFSALAAKASVATESAVNLIEPVLQVCHSVAQNILTKNDPVVDYKTNYNTFCSSPSTFLNTSVVTYSYDLNIAVSNITFIGSEMATFGDTIFASFLNAHTCNSGLTYIPNGEYGWNIWAEEFNTNNLSCLSPNPFVVAGTQLVAFENLVADKKTSFCVTLEGDDGWRGTIRGEYTNTNDRRWPNIASIPCYRSNVGFPVVTNCFNEISDVYSF